MTLLEIKTKRDKQFCKRKTEKRQSPEVKMKNDKYGKGLSEKGKTEKGKLKNGKSEKETTGKDQF